MGLGFTTKSIDFSDPLKTITPNISGLIAKASLVNLDTNETYKFLFNPTEIKKPAIQAVYEKHNVMFRSHPKYQYKYTEGAEWVFQLYLHGASSGAQNALNILSLSRNLNNDTAFLESLVYPLANKGIKDRRPPRVRFVWPNLANVRVIVTSVGTTHQKFNFRLQQMMTVVDVTLAEDPDVGTTSNLVRQAGATGRPGLLGALLDKLPADIGGVVDKVTSLF